MKTLIISVSERVEVRILIATKLWKSSGDGCEGEF